MDGVVLVSGCCRILNVLLCVYGVRISWRDWLLAQIPWYTKMSVNLNFRLQKKNEKGNRNWQPFVVEKPGSGGIRRISEPEPANASFF
jgi:hypothetical protein